MPAKKITKTSKGAKPPQSTSKRMEGFLPRQWAFVQEYLIEPNATKAALAAGYSPKTAAAIGSENLRKPHIASYLAQKTAVIARAQDERLEAMVLTKERVERETARIAFFDPRKIVDASGSPIPLHLLDEDTVAAIEGVDISEYFTGSGDSRKVKRRTYKFKIGGKNAALDRASKILGLFEADNRQKADPLVALLGQLAARNIGVVDKDPALKPK